MITSFGLGGYDFDAMTLAFMSAYTGGGDTNTLEVFIALDRLVRDIKGQANGSYATNNILSKLKAVYPVIGATASGHKWNLIDPRDLDAAYRWTFINSPTHDAAGIHLNGVSQYVATHFLPSSVFTTGAGFGFYTPTNDLTGTQAVGVFDPGNTKFVQINITAGNVCIGGASTLASFSLSRSDGWLSVVRSTLSRIDGYRNTTSLGNNTGTDAGVYPGAGGNQSFIFFGGRNGGGGTPTPDIFSKHTISFGAIFLGLTSSEHTGFYNAIQAFQTILSRQV